MSEFFKPPRTTGAGHTKVTEKSRRAFCVSLVKKNYHYSVRLTLIISENSCTFLEQGQRILYLAAMPPATDRNVL